MPPSSQKALGQYFTVSEALQTFVFDHVKHKGAPLLEPSFGAGHLLRPFLAHNPAYPMTCCELDATVKPVVRFDPAAQTVLYGDFTEMTTIHQQRFRTIVGNPPYVKQRGKGANLYIRFIELCFGALAEEDGELLFIVPSDFLKLTSAAPILEKMFQQGSFTDVWFPHDERLFEGANIDVVVFRYERGYMSNKVTVNGTSMQTHMKNGIVTFRPAEGEGEEKRPGEGGTLADAFHVYVGLVSGRDEIYRSAEHANIRLLADEGREEPYIFPEVFPTGNQERDAYLLAHKESLMARKIKAFTEKNWFEWGAPRNIAHIRAHWGKPCIYVRTLTRKTAVAFTGTVQYFGGALLCLVPKQDMTPTQLEAVKNHMNTEAFQRDYIYAGRFKMGHKQVSNVALPAAAAAATA
jgi:adenine-specific DNA-methyltransferase